MGNNDWDRLMRQARIQATLYGERAKVQAGLLSDRAARVTRSKWIYVVMAPEAWHSPRDWKEAKLRASAAKALGLRPTGMNWS